MGKTGYVTLIQSILDKYIDLIGLSLYMEKILMLYRMVDGQRGSRSSLTYADVPVKGTRMNLPGQGRGVLQANPDEAFCGIPILIGGPGVIQVPDPTGYQEEWLH
jgi:hypothetical protein